MDVWIGIAAIIIGMGSCFCGYLIYLLIAPRLGPLILVSLIYGYLLGQSFVPASHPGLPLVIGLSVTLLLAVLAHPVWGISVSIIGGALGFMILSSLGIALNASLAAVIIMGVLGAALVGFQFHRANHLSVMLATTFNGAIQAVYGLGLIFQSLALGNGRANSLAVVAIVVLGGFGLVVQCWIFKD